MNERLEPVIKAMRFRLEQACGEREQLDELDQLFFDTAAEAGCGHGARRQAQSSPGGHYRRRSRLLTPVP